MSFLMSAYEVRLLEIQSLRNLYLPTVTTNMERWNVSKLFLLEEIEYAFDWIIEEAIGNLIGCRIENHYNYDLGKCLYDTLYPDFHRDIRFIVEPCQLEPRKKMIKHIKVMVVGNLLILAALFKD